MIIKNTSAQQDSIKMKAKKDIYIYIQNILSEQQEKYLRNLISINIDPNTDPKLKIISSEFHFLYDLQNFNILKVNNSK